MCVFREMNSSLSPRSPVLQPVSICQQHLHLTLRESTETKMEELLRLPQINLKYQVKYIWDYQGLVEKFFTNGLQDITGGNDVGKVEVWHFLSEAVGTRQKEKRFPDIKSKQAIQDKTRQYGTFGEKINNKNKQTSKQNHAYFTIVIILGCYYREQAIGLTIPNRIPRVPTRFVFEVPIIQLLNENLMLHNAACQPSTVTALLSLDLSWSRHAFQVENAVISLAQSGPLFGLLFLTNCPCMLRYTDTAACLMCALDS